MPRVRRPPPLAVFARGLLRRRLPELARARAHRGAAAAHPPAGRSRSRTRAYLLVLTWLLGCLVAYLLTYLLTD